MTSVWILGDQLLDPHPALARARADGERVEVVMVESARRLRRLPYRKKKLVLLLTAMRHHAAALQQAAYRVDYRRAPDYTTGLRSHVHARRPERLIVMAASGWDMRRFQERLGARLRVPVEVVPNTQFLVDRHPAAPTYRPPAAIRWSRSTGACAAHSASWSTSVGRPLAGAGTTTS